MDLFIHELPKSRPREGEEVKKEAPASAPLEAPDFDAEVPGKIFHRQDLHHQSVGAEVVTILVPPPVKGANRFSNLSPVSFAGFNFVGSFSTVGSSGYVVPQIEFPKFDGTNPKIWIKRCENFFEVCDIPDNHWVKLATMNFVSSAAFWMQTIEVNLCKAVVERFERDQHTHVVRHFFHIKQSGTVGEYVELFDELLYQLLAHEPFVNPVVITSKFVDWLKPEIKAIILVHRPKDLDIASSLALFRKRC